MMIFELSHAATLRSRRATAWQARSFSIRPRAHGLRPIEDWLRMTGVETQIR
jgi:hypothetical protein